MTKKQFLVRVLYGLVFVSLCVPPLGGWAEEIEEPNKAVPHPPTTPPPPAPPSPADAGIGTCIFTTENGPDVLTFNDATGAVLGSFSGQGGTVSGIKEGTKTRGVWRRGNKSGEFEMFHETWGYFADWKIRGDTDWRGEWEGKIVRCE